MAPLLIGGGFCVSLSVLSPSFFWVEMRDVRFLRQLDVKKKSFRREALVASKRLFPVHSAQRLLTARVAVGTTYRTVWSSWLGL